MKEHLTYKKGWLFARVKNGKVITAPLADQTTEYDWLERSQNIPIAIIATNRYNEDEGEIANYEVYYKGTNTEFLKSKDLNPQVFILYKVLSKFSDDDGIIPLTTGYEIPNEYTAFRKNKPAKSAKRKPVKKCKCK